MTLEQMAEQHELDEAIVVFPLDDNTYLIERLGLAVQVSAATPGVTPTGFVALVEVVDGEGYRHLVKVASTGASDERVERWLKEGTLALMPVKE